MRRNLYRVASVTVVTGILFAGCTTTDDRGTGDAPSTQIEDEERLIWPNADTYPNISAFCIGNNGIYTATGSQRPPVVVPDDPECADDGVLRPENSR